MNYLFSFNASATCENVNHAHITYRVLSYSVDSGDVLIQQSLVSYRKG